MSISEHKKTCSKVNTCKNLIFCLFSHFIKILKKKKKNNNDAFKKKDIVNFTEPWVS